MTSMPSACLRFTVVLDIHFFPCKSCSDTGQTALLVRNILGEKGEMVTESMALKQDWHSNQ